MAGLRLAHLFSEHFPSVLAFPQHRGGSAEDLVDVAIHIVWLFLLFVDVEQLILVQPAFRNHGLHDDAVD